MTTVDINQMPVAEKLLLMEQLWESLCSKDAAVEPVPDWHAGVLEQRLRRLDDGTDISSPWNEAKERVREQSRSR